jgi:hypothetical protein
MPSVRALVAVAFAMIACASCAPDSDGPTAAPPSKTSTPLTSSPTPTIPADLASFGPDERAAFTAAIAALRQFSTTNDRFLRQGKLTKRQAAFYRRNSINWVDDWANLSQFVNEKITFKGTPIEVWVRPVAIDLVGGDGQVVNVKRCLDQSRMSVYTDGVGVPQPQLKSPHVYRVKLLMRPNETWWRVGLPKQGATC